MKTITRFAEKYHMLIAVVALSFALAVSYIPESSCRDTIGNDVFLSDLHAANVSHIDLQQLHASLALIAPGDVEIILVIPAAKVADFSAGFLAKLPIPMIEDPAFFADPNSVGPVPMIPQYTPKEWITEWLRRQAMRAYRHGKVKLAQDAAIFDPNVIQ